MKIQDQARLGACNFWFNVGSSQGTGFGSSYNEMDYGPDAEYLSRLLGYEGYGLNAVTGPQFFNYGVNPGPPQHPDPGVPEFQPLPGPDPGPGPQPGPGPEPGGGGDPGPGGEIDEYMLPSSYAPPTRPVSSFNSRTGAGMGSVYSTGPGGRRAAPHQGPGFDWSGQTPPTLEEMPAYNAWREEIENTPIFDEGMYEGQDQATIENARNIAAQGGISFADLYAANGGPAGLQSFASSGVGTPGPIPRTPGAGLDPVPSGGVNTGVAGGPPPGSGPRNPRTVTRQGGLASVMQGSTYDPNVGIPGRDTPGPMPPTVPNPDNPPRNPGPIVPRPTPHTPRYTPRPAPGPPPPRPTPAPRLPPGPGPRPPIGPPTPNPGPYPPTGPDDEPSIPYEFTGPTGPPIGQNPDGSLIYGNGRGRTAWGIGGASGNRQISGGALWNSYAGTLENPEIDQEVRDAITQEGMNAARSAFSGARGALARRTAATGNSAGNAAAVASMARGEAGVLGQQARENLIGFEQEAQRRREGALAGIGNLYAGETAYLGEVNAQRGALASRPRRGWQESTNRTRGSNFGGGINLSYGGGSGR